MTRFLLFLTVFFTAVQLWAVSPAGVRNIWIEPAYLCPGQAVTVHYEASHGNNAALAAIAAFSTNNTVLDWAADFFFIKSGNPNGVCPATVLPGSWDGMPVVATANVNSTFLPYTAVTCVPAGYTLGQMVNVVIAVKNDWGSAAGPWNDTSFITVEVSCTKSVVTNTGGFWDARTTVDVIVDTDCGQSPTATPTNTVTYTSTATPTATPTVTVTSTPTATYTYTTTPTDTPTVTVTSTATATYTYTATSTDTPTVTYTATQTVTSTVTYTATPSATVTDTITPGPSPTDTPTFTVTASDTATDTVTATRTPTSTPTHTATASPTFTATSTFSATPTVTETATQTSTPSQTPIFTATSTPTFSPTSSVTSTASPTFTATFTPTVTQTFTPTLSVTDTATVTHTPTATDTFTATATVTASATVTPTQTISPSFTVSPTASPTPVRVPYKVTIGVYNSAGERVRLVYSGPVELPINEIELNSGKIVSGQGTLTLQLPGRLSDGTSSLSWDGYNDAGQPIGGGTYYYKVENEDPFGKTSALIEPIQVIAAPIQATLSIYNSAGELILSAVEPAGGSTVDIAVGGKTFSPVFAQGNGPVSNKLRVWLIDNLGTRTAWDWDGKNSMGLPVQSGFYTIQLLRPQSGGSTDVVTREVSLLQNSSVVLDPEPMIAPNPITAGMSSEARLNIFYNTMVRGTVRVRIFNIVGELIIESSSPAASGNFNMSLGRVASGIYFVEFALWDQGAMLNRRILKFALQR